MNPTLTERLIVGSACALGILTCLAVLFTSGSDAGRVASILGLLVCGLLLLGVVSA